MREGVPATVGDVSGDTDRNLCGRPQEAMGVAPESGQSGTLDRVDLPDLAGGERVAANVPSTYCPLCEKSFPVVTLVRGGGYDLTTIAHYLRQYAESNYQPLTMTRGTLISFSRHLEGL